MLSFNLNIIHRATLQEAWASNSWSVQQKFETLKAKGTEKVENEKKRFNQTAQEQLRLLLFSPINMYFIFIWEDIHHNTWFHLYTVFQHTTPRPLRIFVRNYLRYKIIPSDWIMQVPLVLLNRLTRIIYAFWSDGDRCSNNLLRTPLTLTFNYE